MFARICLRTQTCRAANRLVQELETKKRVSSYGNARLFLPFLRSVASRDTFSPLVQNRKTSTRKIAMSLSPASDGGLCDATYSCVSFEYVDIASGVRGWRSLGRLASTSSYTCGSQVVRPLSVGDFCQGRVAHSTADWSGFLTAAGGEGSSQTIVATIVREPPAAVSSPDLSAVGLVSYSSLP